MSLSDNYEPTKDLANAVTTIFTADWDPINTDYVEIYSEDYTTGVQTEITSGFTAERLSNNTLKVTFDDAPGDATPADSVYIILSRATPNSQEQPFTTSSGFQAKVAEGVWDKTVAIVQEVVEGIARTLSYPLGTDSSVSQSIPVPEAGKPLVGASDGLSFENGDTDITALDTAVADTQASAAAAASSASDASDDASDASDSADAAASSAASVPTMATIMAATYPVGSVYTNATVATNPGTLLGIGTWVAIEGECVVGIKSTGAFDALGSVSEGETTVDASHTHDVATDWGVTTSATEGVIQALVAGTADNVRDAAASKTSDSGGSATQNNIQPSYVCYVWRRTA